MEATSWTVDHLGSRRRGSAFDMNKLTETLVFNEYESFGFGSLMNRWLTHAVTEHSAGGHPADPGRGSIASAS